MGAEQQGLQTVYLFSFVCVSGRGGCGLGVRLYLVVRGAVRKKIE